MKPRLFVTILLAFIFQAFSACSATGTETVPVQRQPPVSIAQRQASILTPTGHSASAALENQPAAPEAQPSQTSTVVDSTPAPTAAWTATIDTGLNVSSTPNPTLTNTAVIIPPTTSPSTTPIHTSTAPTTCSPTSSSAFASEIIQLINQQRAAQGIPLLNSQTQLTGAAQAHSSDMACNQFFSHTSPTGGTLFDRLAAAGYSYSWAGENIAAGYTTPAAVVEGWMDSEGHRANILNENFTQIGVGYASWDGSDYGSYWTAVFSSP
jgi:uncharacterized protein YkwD